jgi:hypothetical protein
MSEPARNPFDLLLDQIRAVVCEEIAKALDKRKPAQLQFSTKEAAVMLNVPESWLAAKTRAGEVPHRQMGHYRLFSLRDIDAIMTQSAVGNGSIPMKYNGHDGKEIQADSAGTRVEPVPTGEAIGGMAEHGGALGSGGQADSGPGRTLHEAPSRKKTKRGEKQCR